MLQNAKQIPKPSVQQKTITFDQLLTRHLEKAHCNALKNESYFEKISKAVANIECQHQTSQQNTANLKYRLFSTNEIITAPININIQTEYKNHHIRKRAYI